MRQDRTVRSKASFKDGNHPGKAARNVCPEEPAGPVAPGGSNDLLSRLLRLAGVIEISLFGVPLLVAGRLIKPYVANYDPHIYKEYGVARSLMGLTFLLGAANPRARITVARAGALYYASNFLISTVDLVSGNVDGVEAAVMGLSAGLGGGMAYLTGPRAGLKTAKTGVSDQALR